MNNELETIWKEAIVTYLMYYPGICLEELKNPTKTLTQVRFSAGDFNRAPPNSGSGEIPLCGWLLNDADRNEIIEL
jgi:hypothetical protein